MPDTMKPAEKLVGHIVHGLLYLLMFGVPLGGWLYSSAKGYPVVFLGVLPLPNLIDKTTPELAHQIKDLHELGGWTVVVLALLHAAAALKHHFISKDDVLKRML
jgi:cytochrome b561